MRDRGKGGRFKLICVTIGLAVLVVIMVGTKNIWMTREISTDEVVSGSAGAIDMQEVDASGLSVFFRCSRFISD